ncbi:MAG TPA: GNAT family N-acetyltransferase [Pyrinomonadaceae bacterium]|nr:GNAT family N-acetyltransferase [Pyrinomonadaceae bacterium]
MPARAKSEQLRLQPATAEDEALLLEIYAGTRAEEMLLVPWTDEQRHAFIQMQFNAQREHYSLKYPTADHDIIYDGDVPVGRLYVARMENEIRIVDVTLLTRYRRNGLGTQLITDLMNEATTTRRPLRIYVESFNPSLALFERLGFQRTAEHGMHLLMEWMPVEAKL